MRSGIATILLAFVLLLHSCAKHDPVKEREKLPLPPLGETGVANNRYYQTQFGFSVGVPKKWFAFAGGEDWDELVRFSDHDRKMNAGLYCRWLYENEKFDAAAWFTAAEQEFANRGTQAQRVGEAARWPVRGGGFWTAVAYDLKDPVNREWSDTLCVLDRGDLLVWMHLVLAKRDAKKPAGNKLVETMKEAMTVMEWFRPIGPRGITLEHYELIRFSDDFIAACESQNTYKVLRFFDDTYPGLKGFTDWYRKAAAPLLVDGKEAAQLRVEPAGMVIQEGSAVLAFKFTRLESGKPVLAEKKAFRLSKAEGPWRIVGDLEKE